MSERPELNNSLDGKTFLSFYYLKEELVSFCRENNLPASGGKTELTERIAYFLDTGRVANASAKRKATVNVGVITENTIIEANIVCSEKHRAFFKEQIGKSFSFNVLFQKWLKSNAGKTYGDAVEAYYKILEEKKNSKIKHHDKSKKNRCVGSELRTGCRNSQLQQQRRKTGRREIAQPA